jgi:hypothetical protein
MEQAKWVRCIQITFCFILLVVSCLEGLLQDHPDNGHQEDGKHGQNFSQTENDSCDDTDGNDSDTDELYEVGSDETVSSQDEEDFVDEETQ